MEKSIPGLPLRCKYKSNKIVIKVGLPVLKFAIEMHPDIGLWSEEGINVTDIEVMARAIVDEINRDAEDGSTVLTRMLDAAILTAVESGCDGWEEKCPAK